MAYLYKNTDEKIKLQVWNKGRVINGFDPSIWRRDTCGAVMKYSDHGETTKYGWEIDHIYPKARGGSDLISNLQPMQWSNNRSKGDTYPWNCPI